MKKKNLSAGLRFAILLLWGGLLFHNTLLSKTLSTAISPADVKKSPKGTRPEPTIDRDHTATLSSMIAEAGSVKAAGKAGNSEAHLSKIITDLQRNPRRVTLLPPAMLRTIDSETLWLARAIFSETKQPREQELVAWVIRNRVETRYRGKTSYQDVILDPYQFSAFNPENRLRQFYVNLGPESKTPGWQTALSIAYSVQHASPIGLRQFSTKTRHFYSERSMVGQAHPEWAEGLHPVKPGRKYYIDEKRFRFYEGIW